ncbi:MAG TPA: hypothetical protein VGW33_11670 [Terriglobia bacterium]|nr:hypothetical protein [Terriglobia bacterium]
MPIGFARQVTTFEDRSRLTPVFEGAKDIGTSHISEMIQYRSLDRNYGA